MRHERNKVTLELAQLALLGEEPQRFLDRGSAQAAPGPPGQDQIRGPLGEAAGEARQGCGEKRLERAGQMSAVRSDIRKRKALEWLLERAEVLDPEGATIDRSELELPSDEDEDDDTATDEVAEATEGES